MDDLSGISTPPRNHTRLMVIGGVVTLLVLIVIGYYFIVVRTPSSQEIPFALSVGTVPASRLYVQNQQNKTLEPLTITYNTQKLSVLDIVKVDDGSTYYILADVAPVPIGNIYKKDTTGTITKITNTPTAKYNLVYNADRKEFVYQSLSYVDEKQFVSTRDWSLVVYSLKSNTETVLTTGSQPVFSEDGKYLIFQKNNTIQTVHLESHATSTLLSLALYPVFAVNPSAHSIVAYNRKTHALDTYTMTGSGSVAYSKSVSITDIPTMLAFVGTDLYSATVAGDSKSGKKYLVTKNPGEGKPSGFVFTGIDGFAFPQRIYSYEK